MEIKSTSSVDTKGITCLIYGDSGVGKTSLATTLDGKNLLVSAEGGRLPLRRVNIPYVEIEGKNATEKYMCLRDIFSNIYQLDYDTIFIDSLTEISQILVDYNFELVNNDRSKSLIAYGEASKQLRSIIKFCRDNTKFNFILTALAQVEKDELNRRFKLPDVVGKLALQLPQFFDGVFYLHKDAERKEDNSNKRFLFTDHDAIITKDRSGNLPSIIEEPNLSEIIKRMKS